MAEAIMYLSNLKNYAFCFEESTEVKKENQGIVPVSELFKGDRILSIKDDMLFYDEVINITLIDGKFEAHKFELSNGKSIKVTSPHLMMIWHENSLQMVAAKSVKIHDIMLMENGEFSKIVNVIHLTLNKKVNVNTKSGFMYANGILTSGMCENIPRELPKVALDIQVQYKATDHIFA